MPIVHSTEQRRTYVLVYWPGQVTKKAADTMQLHKQLLHQEISWALLVSDLPAFRQSYRVTKAQKTKKKSIFFKKSQNEEIASKVKNSVY